MVKAILAFSIFLVLYLVFWPTDIEPQKWEPTANPGFTGVYTQNELLKAIKVYSTDGYGPEDLAVKNGWAYMGLVGGRIIRLQLDTGLREDYANTQGRPLGLAWDPAGNLLVADAYKGLLRVFGPGKIEVLATESDGVAFGFTDDVDVGSDGVIYFTDASKKFSQDSFQVDALEHRPNGRLLSYDPSTRQTKTLLDGLYFPNGVAVGVDGRFLLFNETWEYRVNRYWLKGPKAGTVEVLIDHLPGFPDGISRGADGVFWLALASPRSKVIDLFAPFPALRKAFARLPRFLWPKEEPYSGVFGIDSNGDIKYNFQDPSGSKLQTITSVEEFDGKLYLGSLTESKFGVYTPIVDTSVDNDTGKPQTDSGLNHGAM